VARQPLPPQVICKILGMDEEDVKAAFENGKPPTASKDQLVDAVCFRERERAHTHTRATSQFLASGAVKTLVREHGLLGEGWGVRGSCSGCCSDHPAFFHEGCWRRRRKKRVYLC